MLLLEVAVVLTITIFVINLLLHRSLLDSTLFALAIAVGITPQLLPAVVSTSLATGSRQLARRKVLVKRLVCIEDLSDMDVLITDKTGTLTGGSISYRAAIDPDGKESPQTLRYGLLATEERGQAGGNSLDAALWQAAPSGLDAYHQIAVVPFDHERRMTSVLIDTPDNGRLIVVKGAPESILARCACVPDTAPATLQTQFAAGSRVVAVASRPAPQLSTLSADDEHDLRLDGFLVFLDPPKAGPTCSAPAGSSNRWPPRPWSSSPSAPGASRSCAAAPAGPWCWPPSPRSPSASSYRSPRCPACSDSSRCRSDSSPPSPA